MNQGVDDRLLALEQRVSRLEKNLAGDEPAQVRARRIPADWQPDDRLLNWVKEKFPDVDEATERDKFRDYWIARGDTRRDWAGSYRNWIRKAEEISTSRPSVLRGGSANRTADISARNRERRDRVADKLAALWRKPSA